MTRWRLKRRGIQGARRFLVIPFCVVLFYSVEQNCLIAFKSLGIFLGLGLATLEHMVARGSCHFEALFTVER